MEGLLRFSGFLDASLVRYLMDPQENEAAFDGEAHEVEPSDHSLHHSAEDDRSHLQSGDGASPEMKDSKGEGDLTGTVDLTGGESEGLNPCRRIEMGWNEMKGGKSSCLL
ncbi:hypothetical protein CDL15_Pgr025935 [Punica granatum]|nr:hypothetical protein CDL15_Pgr025935 [Punica granatum]